MKRHLIAILTVALGLLVLAACNNPSAAPAEPEPTPDPTPPAPEEMAPGMPTGLTVTADGQYQLDLAWTAPEETGSSDITGYQIEVSRDNATWMVLVSSQAGTTYSHTELAPGSTRHYRVSALNSAGAGDPSAVAMGTTDSVPPPPPDPVELDLTLDGWGRDRDATADGDFVWEIDVEGALTGRQDLSLDLIFAIDRQNVSVAVTTDGTDANAICGWNNAADIEVTVSGLTISFEDTLESPCTATFTAFGDLEGTATRGDTVSFELNLDRLPDTTPVDKAAKDEIGITGSVMIERMDDDNADNGDQSRSVTYTVTGTAEYDKRVIDAAGN